MILITVSNELIKSPLLLFIKCGDGPIKATLFPSINFFKHIRIIILVVNLGNINYLNIEFFYENRTNNSGPLVSYGKTGKTMFYTPLQLTSTKNSMKSYNCLENVSNILVSSEQIFHETLLVTWEDNNISKSLTNSNVLILNDEHKFEGKVAAMSGPRKWNNVLKQAKTTYEGVLALEKLGCEYVVKTRTDMEINLEMLSKVKYGSI